MAPVVVGLLGVLNFIWGFLPSFSVQGGVPDSVPRSIYAMGPGYLPILLLAAGLLAFGAAVPRGTARLSLAAAAVSLAAMIGVIVVGFVTGSMMDVIGSLSGGQGPSIGKGIGLILLLIFSVLQTAAAVGWWLMDAGVISPSGAGGASRPAAGRPHDAANAPAGPDHGPNGPAGTPGGPANTPGGPANAPGAPGAASAQPYAWPGHGPGGATPGEQGPQGPVGAPHGAPGFGATGPQPSPYGDQRGAESEHHPGSFGQPGSYGEHSGRAGGPPAFGEHPASGPTPGVAHQPDSPPPSPAGFGTPGSQTGFPAPDTGGQSAVTGGGTPPTGGSAGPGNDDNPEETRQLRF